jgi:hypothetical protein
MIRKLLPTVAGVSVLFLVIAVALTNRAVHAQVSMNTIGLLGLNLIGPMDPGFEEKAASLLKDRQYFAYGMLKPYAVILENTSQKTVVAYALRWEYPAPKGQIGIWDRNFSQGTRLLDGGKRRTNASDDEMGPTIDPGQFKLITPESFIGKSRWGIQPVPESDQYRAYLQSIVNRFGSGNLTVTLDAVFFEDGTFAGPDRSGYFDVFKAEVMARQDLMSEIVAANSAGRLPEVASKLEASLADAGEPILQQGASSDDFYHYYRHLYLKEFVNIRAKLGDQAALGHAYQKFYHNAPTLAKP